MQIQLLQWNIKINSNTKKIVEFLKQKIANTSIINLQEVSIPASLIIKNELQLNCSYSINLRSPGEYEGKNRKMGVMTIVKNGTIDNYSLVDKSIFPERTLITKIKLEKELITCLNFHSLTGVDYKKAKSSNFASIASYIHANSIDILSCDANEPKIDSISDIDLEFFDNRDKGQMASLLFGKNKIHKLIDTYKMYCIKNSLDLAEGYTHIIGINKKRYDFIYCKEDWEIISSKSYYNEALSNTSDHALVESIIKI